jgi:hypothetical protein
MPNYQAKIRGVVAGDGYRVRWELRTVPDDGAVTKAWLTVKEQGKEDSPDATAVFQKVTTTSLVLTQGQITNDGATGNIASGYFWLLPEETILLTPGDPEVDRSVPIYVYDIQVNITLADTTTYPKTPEIGTIQTIQGVTSAVS